MIFIDEAVLHVRGGRGGNGCIAFRREKFVPKGGPAGGDGGHGGSVYLLGDSGTNTLYHLRNRNLYSAQKGRHGEGSNKTGRSGEDLTIKVPLGTEVTEKETGQRVGELVEHGARLEVASGGRGGRGNARFASPTQQAPRHAEPGGEGQELLLQLELKLLADVGVIGLPNAGKSTFISTVSAARPKVADYPFTTLIPQLGVVATDPDREPFVIADLPGLIRGAADGAGLGTQFLRHVERCRVLLHLVDLSTGEASAGDDLLAVEEELDNFGRGLLTRDRLVVGSKLDAADETRSRELAAEAKRRGLDYFEISSATGAGVKQLLRLLERRAREGQAA